MWFFEAICQMAASFVARSVFLCGARGGRLRAALARALTATILLHAWGVGIALAAPPSRVSSMRKDLSQAEVIYLATGLVSVVEFPAPILEVRNGNPNSIRAMISTVSPKELTLTMNQSIPSNLVIRAGKRMYVFDIVPSKSTHQDYVKVSGAYGSPAFASNTEPSETIEISPFTKPRQSKHKLIESEVIQ